MSDDEREKAIISKLQDQLAARRASLRCPMCQTDRWGLLRSSSLQTRFPPAVGLREPEVYALACLNCGFIRTHAAAVLEEPVQDEGKLDQ